MNQNGSSVPWDPAPGVPLHAACRRPEARTADTPLAALVMSALLVIALPLAVLWLPEVLR